MTVIIGILSVLVVIYLIPFLVYGLFSAFAGVKPPDEKNPLKFLVSIFISKFGTAIAFVLIYYFSKNSFPHPMLYAFLWWLMYVIEEIGQAIGPHYSWKEALAGIISETIYFPLATVILIALLP